jgi:beta-glucanase (GH16 family)
MARPSERLNKRILQHRRKIVIFAITLVGATLLSLSQAASFSIGIEPETNAPSNLVMNDGTASGSKAIMFGSAPTGNINPPVAADAGKNWNLKFSEDFDGNSVDLNKWTPCFSWAGDYSGCTTSFNAGREAYQPSQVQLSNGTAKLIAEPANPKIWGLDYKSGLLSTTNKPSSITGVVQGPSLYKFTYGYVEARIKMPPQKGFFSAFWMLPVSKAPNNGWPYEYEIDILEALGGNDPYAYQTIHYNNRSQQWQASPPGQCKNWTASDLYGNFHTYGVNWQPSYIDFYIDGMKCGRFTTEVWKSDMELILNLMVDHSWQKAYPSLYGATGTAVLEADYVKVWQQQ